MNWEITPVSTATAAGLFSSMIFSATGLFTALRVVPAFTLPPPKRTQISEDTTQAKTNTSTAVSTPDILARQWKFMYDTGHIIGPSTLGLSSVSWLYVTYMLPAGTTRARSLYIAGAICTLSVPPLTILFMQSINTQLLERAEAAETGKPLNERGGSASGEGTSTEELLSEWSRLHFMRSLLPLIGIACVIAANVK